MRSGHVHQNVELKLFDFRAKSGSPTFAISHGQELNVQKFSCVQ